ncbi:MAG: type 4a pilus biogenesis protein PilO [Ignavibacteriales bacterium]
MSKEINAKQVFIIILILAGLFLLYKFVYSPVQKDIKNLKAKEIDLSNQLSELQSIQNNASKMNEQKKSLIDSQTDFLKQFPHKLLQENVVLNLIDIISKSPGIKIQTAGLEPPQDFQIDTEPNAVMKLQISGNGSYGAIKNFISVINNYRPRVLAHDLNMASSASGGITFSLKLDFLGYNGLLDDGYAKLNPTFTNEDMQKYKSNGEKNKTDLFENVSGVSISTLVSAIKDNAQTNNGKGDDFFVMLSPSTYDLPGVDMGKSGDASKEINNPKNGLTKVEFIFDYKNGAYFYKYKADDKIIPANYSTEEKFIPKNADSIVVNVKGIEIMKAKDNVSAEISIVNNTSIPVNINVQSITKESGKIRINKTKGLVIDNWR